MPVLETLDTWRRPSAGPSDGGTVDLSLWGAILGFAVLDTLSPTTLAVTIVVLLTGGPRVVGRTLLYLATLAVCYFAFGVALLLGIEAAVDVQALLDESLDPHFFALGIGLVAVSFVIDPGTKAAKAARRQRAAERAAARRAGQGQRLRRGGAFVMIGLGLTTFALEFATVVPYMAAIGLMAGADLPASRWVVGLAAYNLVMVTPSLALLVAKVVWAERLRARYEAWAERLDAATRPAAAWIMGAVGVILVLDSASRLFS